MTGVPRGITHDFELDSTIIRLLFELLLCFTGFASAMIACTILTLVVPNGVEAVH